MPRASGGSLTPAGASLLSFLSSASPAARSLPPSISACNFSLQPNVHGGASRVSMVFDTDMLLPLPHAYSTVRLRHYCKFDSRVCQLIRALQNFNWQKFKKRAKAGKTKTKGGRRKRKAKRPFGGASKQIK